MGHAKYIGRVGALAVTLGVGWAVATTPGIAYADPLGSPGDSSSSAGSTPSPAKPPSANGIAGTDPSSSASKPTSGSENQSSPGKGAQGSAGTAGGDADQQSPSNRAGEAQTPLGAHDAGKQPTGDERGVGRVSRRSTPPSDSTGQVGSLAAPVGERSTPAATRTSAVSALPDPVTKSVVPVSATPASTTTPAAAAATTTTNTVVPEPTPPARQRTVMSAVSDFMAAVVGPMMATGNGSPGQLPMLTAMLSLVRNEFERNLAPRNATAASQQTASLAVDPTKQHVLVIGVDGTNLSRILADDYNQNFFDLMDTSTTASSSIVGHTTISNPSWTAILTGVWGERTGVINNVFTPWTYDDYPTVFNQLETLNPAIETMTIADWNVINAISGAGSIPADRNVYVGQIEGDTDWLATDDEVADRTVDAILATDGSTPNFLFSYFVSVDENGHMYGGDSPQYAAAIRNMDDNLGEILDAVAAREAATGEDWTVIVVTDHGHQPQQGFGHGFQSPDETETFVIADGPDFQDGYINLQYEIVDTTPTVVRLFGGTPLGGSDGVPLMVLGAADVDPVDLRQALEDAIAMNEYPDIITNVALSLRTIFGTLPYYVFGFATDTGAGLPSFLAVPAKLLFDTLYVATNVPAQIVAFGTGVTGARLFPLLPPAAPNFPPAQEAGAANSAIVA